MEVEIQEAVCRIHGLQHVCKAVVEEVDENTLVGALLQKCAEEIEIALDNAHAVKIVICQRKAVVDIHNVHVPAQLLICLYARMDKGGIILVFQRRIARRRDKHVPVQIAIYQKILVRLRQIFCLGQLHFAVRRNIEHQYEILQPNKFIDKYGVQPAGAHDRAVTVEQLERAARALKQLALEAKRDLFFPVAAKELRVDQKAMLSCVVFDQQLAVAELRFDISARPPLLF